MADDLSHKQKPVARYEVEQRMENEMRKTLLATAAMAVVSLAVGFGGIAAAQSQMGNESGKGMSGAAPGATAPGTQQKGTGPSGASSGDKTMSPSGGQPAQSTERNGKQNERLGQSPSDQQKGMTRGAQEEKRGTEPKGAQEEHGGKVRGAQEEKRGTEPKGAQEERGVKERGAQDEQGKTGVNESGRLGQSRGSGKASVQLSQDQRTRIQAVIGKEHASRFRGAEHFDISVGSRIPRDVHLAVLPEDIVSIVPEYRGFEYVLVGDSILIVDPATLEIIAVIPA
jgi:hypothetical protein